MRRLIVCPGCAEKLMDEDSPLYLAMFGPQGLNLKDDAILVSQPVEQWTHLQFDRQLTTVTCDGSCGRTLGISASSAWFLQQKQQLEGMPLQ